jgi:hypothetical protein
MVAAYESALLTEQQAGWWVEDMRRIVLAAEPCSLDDASTMLASTARFLSDAAAPPVRTLAEMLTEVEVARWAHSRMAAGANPATMSNHLLRLRRLMRVQRGLPARIAVRGESRPSRDPLGRGELERLTSLDAWLQCFRGRCVRRCRWRGLVGADAVGGRIERAGECYVLRRCDGSSRRIIDELAANWSVSASVPKSSMGHGNAPVRLRPAATSS